MFMIPIKEFFLSVQGEGLHAGKSAFFIRTQGCDIGCHWCDEPKSWDLDAGINTTADDLLTQLSKSNSNIVIFTGGEPLMWNKQPLTDNLHNKGMSVHIETSGAYPLSGDFDWICLSPKKNNPPKEAIIPKANELKVIIHNRNDFKWAEQFTNQCSLNCKLYLQPEWSKAKEMMPEIVDYVMNNPKWNISLQSHKYMNIP